MVLQLMAVDLQFSRLVFGVARGGFGVLRLGGLRG